MRKISIGYFADGVWGLNSLKKILKQNKINIKFVCLRYRTPDKKILNFCKKKRIKVENFAKVNSLSSKKKILNYKCDYLVSMSYDQIFGSFLVDKFKNKIINCHAGNLPFYRGRNVLNWVLINDEKEFGVTVHYVDEGIDTGDIIIQKKSKITDSDTYASLLEKAVALCADSLYESLCHIRLDKVIRIKQSSIHPVGSYFSRRKKGDEYIDWTWNSRRIFNFIRAISNPGPNAQTFHNKSLLKIMRSELIKDAPNYFSNPGEVIGKGKDFLVIKTGDSSLKIFTEDGFSKKNEEKLNKLCIGDRLTSK